MGLARVKTRAGHGLDAPLVTVEVHLANGLPGFHMVGLAETAVKEARDRVRGALINSGFEFPAKRITVNLAPADIPKHGGRYDLPIAIGILAASGVIPEQSTHKMECVGELGLSGEVRQVGGILPVARQCLTNKHIFICPKDNMVEIGLVTGLQFLGVTTLLELYLHFTGKVKLTLCVAQEHESSMEIAPPKWDDVIGQEQAKRGLAIAAAGAHNLLFVGPPGTGKSLLASRLLSLLPPLSVDESLEVAALRSLKGETIDRTTLFHRPYRQPHHTASAIALIGGGTIPQPGEISLAHHGVLFLDELPEFGRQVLDVLREPLETGQVDISRASGSAKFPAQFQLIAAMNPSPTGDIDDQRSTPEQIMRYLNRLSGPLLDRIDLQVDVPKLPDYFLPTPSTQKTDSAELTKHQVQLARDCQLNRQGKLNRYLNIDELSQVCQLSSDDLYATQQWCAQLKLSMRVFHRALKVARTIADLEGAMQVTQTHIAEALSYRALDKLIGQLNCN